MALYHEVTLRVWFGIKEFSVPPCYTCLSYGWNYDHKIHYVNHIFECIEIWDKYKTFRMKNMTHIQTEPHVFKTVHSIS
jgi:hypothetical protein